MVRGPSYEVVFHALFEALVIIQRMMLTMPVDNDVSGDLPIIQPRKTIVRISPERLERGDLLLNLKATDNIRLMALHTPTNAKHPVPTLDTPANVRDTGAKRRRLSKNWIIEDPPSYGISPRVKAIDIALHVPSQYFEFPSAAWSIPS